MPLTNEELFLHSKYKMLDKKTKIERLRDLALLFRFSRNVFGSGWLSRIWGDCGELGSSPYWQITSHNSKVSHLLLEPLENDVFSGPNDSWRTKAPTSWSTWQDTVAMVSSSSKMQRRSLTLSLLMLLSKCGWKEGIFN